ncbi:uncharacterized protein LOC134430783 [Melospiza melodia melodia]|uniref:uncharacterized protein LOC134430783 n=1 Tax=Melospiza melodia melodia TaxID=1914991 RepID=UPI002FD57531
MMHHFLQTAPQARRSPGEQSRDPGSHSQRSQLGSCPGDGLTPGPGHNLSPLSADAAAPPSQRSHSGPLRSFPLVLPQPAPGSPQPLCPSLAISRNPRSRFFPNFSPPPPPPRPSGPALPPPPHNSFPSALTSRPEERPRRRCGAAGRPEGGGERCPGRCPQQLSAHARDAGAAGGAGIWRCPALPSRPRTRTAGLTPPATPTAFYSRAPVARDRSPRREHARPGRLLRVRSVQTPLCGSAAQRAPCASLSPLFPFGTGCCCRSAVPPRGRRGRRSRYPHVRHIRPPQAAPPFRCP